MHNQLRYQESCGYIEEMYPEMDEGRLSVELNTNNANPDIGGANIGGDYLVVSNPTLLKSRRLRVKFARAGASALSQHSQPIIVFVAFISNFENPLIFTQLETDYENYAVVYSCNDMMLFGSTQNAWILTRDRMPPDNVVRGERERGSSSNYHPGSFRQTVVLDLFQVNLDSC